MVGVAIHWKSGENMQVSLGYNTRSLIKVAPRGNLLPVLEFMRHENGSPHDNLDLMEK